VGAFGDDALRAFGSFGPYGGAPAPSFRKLRALRWCTCSELSEASGPTVTGALDGSEPFGARDRTVLEAYRTPGTVADRCHPWFRTIPRVHRWNSSPRCAAPAAGITTVRRFIDAYRSSKSGFSPHCQRGAPTTAIELQGEELAKKRSSRKCARLQEGAVSAFRSISRLATLPAANLPPCNPARAVHWRTSVASAMPVSADDKREKLGGPDRERPVGVNRMTGPMKEPQSKFAHVAACEPDQGAWGYRATRARILPHRAAPLLWACRRGWADGATGSWLCSRRTSNHFVRHRLPALRSRLADGFRGNRL
jgi:hypothetical protein